MRLFMHSVLLILLFMNADLQAESHGSGDQIDVADTSAKIPASNRTEASTGHVSLSRSGATVPPFTNANPSEDDIKRLEARIEVEDQALQNERIAIMKEKEGLENDRKRAETQEQIRAYNQRIRLYNDRIANFLRRQSRLEDERIELQAMMEARATQTVKPEEIAETPSGGANELPEDFLAKRRQTIDTEYDTLMREKEALEKDLQEVESQESLIAINARIAEFNNRTKDYTARKNELNSDIVEYNKQVIAGLTQRVNDMKSIEDDKADLTTDLHDNHDEKAFQELREKIDQEEALLAEEYKRLKDERENMDRMRSKANTNEEIRAYNQALETLDARVMAYEKRNESLRSQLQEYNLRLKRMYEQQMRNAEVNQAPTDGNREPEGVSGTD